MKKINTYIHQHPVFLLLLVAVIVTAFSLFAQSEPVIQGKHNDLTSPARIDKARGTVIPQIWRANINETTVSLPIRHLEHYGVQDYFTDAGVRVTELSITTKSLSMIRIYYIDPPLPKNFQGVIGDLTLPKKANLDKIAEIPYKPYPLVTHKKMTEYRVTEREHVRNLYNSLDAVVIDNYGIDLVADQRPQIVREISIGDEE